MKMEIFASFVRYIFRTFTSKASFIILCYVAISTIVVQFCWASFECGRFLASYDHDFFTIW